MAKTATPDEFDFDAWLGTASVPEREVTLYAANALQAQIAKLEDERAQAMEPSKDFSGSWGAPAEADVSAIDERLKALRAELAASGIVFRVRALDPDDGDAIRRRHPDKKGATDDEMIDVYNARILEKMAHQVIAPRTFTAAELKRLRKAIGDPEFDKLFTACGDVNAPTAASSPFWRASSGSSPS